MTGPDTPQQVATHTSPGGPAAQLGLLLVSASILALEVLQTRIFAYCLHPLLLYAAVAFALLGLGASGTLLSLTQSWQRWRVGSVAAASAALFAITQLASHAYFARVSSDLVFGMDWQSIAVSAAMALPYFFAGATVTACLTLAGERIHSAYRVNLIGSAAGCFVVFVALRPLGAPALLAVVAMVSVLGAAAFLWSGAGRFAKALTLIAGIGTTGSYFASDWLFPFQPERSGQLRYLTDIAEKHPAYNVVPEQVFGAWDPTARVEFHRFTNFQAKLPDKIDYLFYSQDGSAGSFVLGLGDDPHRARGLFEWTLYGAGYWMRPPDRQEKVLVIGLGGGPDVMVAQHHRAKSIIAVDINATTIEAVRGPLSEFAGRPYDRPEVELVQMDGRSYVRSSKTHFDLIVMSGADTKSVMAAGSMAISENQLYTVEAFHEYLDHLEPGGHVAIVRFGVHDRLRLAAIAVRTLRERGVANPGDHCVILRQGHWTSMIIGRDPISAQEHARLRARVAAIPSPDSGVHLPIYDLMELWMNATPRIMHPADGPPGVGPDGEPDVDHLFAAVARGAEDEFFAAARDDRSATTDDRPFFFNQQRTSTVLSVPHLHFTTFGNHLRIMALLAGICFLLPIPLFLLRRSSRANLVRTPIYFVCLGFGFMVLEIGLVQKLVQFLGHPSYAVTVVLAMLLVGAGLGSGFAGRLNSSARVVRRFAVPGIIVIATAIMLALDTVALQFAGWSLGGRIALASAALLPLGFVLGVPFPTGLAVLTRTAPAQVPWAIGANGFASVIGASAALPLAMLFGYRALVLLAFVVYVLAALAFPAAPAATASVRSSEA